MAEDKVSISFDDEFRVRVLDADKFKQTEELEAECSAFVASELIAGYTTLPSRTSFTHPRRHALTHTHTHTHTHYFDAYRDAGV